jgi:signal transduction histidine kinase
MPNEDARKDALLQAGLTLAAELSLPVVLQRIVELAVKVTDATYGALGVLGPEGTITEFITTGVSPRQRKAIGHIPTGRGILGLLIREAHPLRLARIADDSRSVGFPPNHPPMASFLGAPVRARGQVFGNIYLTERKGCAEFTAEDQAYLEVLATQAGVAIANASLYEEAKHQQRWLDALHQITVSLLADSSADSVLELVCHEAREVADADVAAIVAPSGQAGELSIVAADGLRGGQLLGMPVPALGSVFGQVIRDGHPVFVVDASRDDRAYHPMASLGKTGPALFVPLKLRGEAFGTLAVAKKVGGTPFLETTVQLVDTFAAQASVALDYSRARHEAQRIGLMDERERIAKELHDGIIQSLFAVGMGLQATALLGGEEQRERIETAVTEIDRVIRDLRNYIFGLRPGILADRQLDQALRSLVADFEASSGVEAAVEIDRGVAAELASKSTEVVQLLREALSNVSRHAEARTCQVRLSRAGSHALLAVTDDGRGFEPKGLSRGQGLDNILGRAKRMGGSLRLTSAPGRGTRLRLRIPI